MEEKTPNIPIQNHFFPLRVAVSRAKAETTPQNLLTLDQQ